MDRRLPIRPDTFTAQMARRELVLEQRLDQIAHPRPQSQRYENPPTCCDEAPTPLTVTALPATIVDDAFAVYTFLGDCTSVSIHTEGDAPTDDGRGYGIQIEITHEASLLTTVELTGTDSDDQALVEAFATGDVIAFAVSDKSVGSADNITVVVTFDGTLVETIEWVNPS